MKFDFRIFRLLLCAILAMLITVACAGDHSSTQSFSTPSSDCRAIQHALGETCVPLRPQRIVTVDSTLFENVLALGIEPIATVVPSVDAPHIRAKAESISGLGSEGEANLEKVLELKPDLILGTDYQKQVYPPLSQIAPTVMAKFTHSGDWKEIFTLTGNAVGQSEKAKQVMDDYYKRLERFKQQMGNRLSQTKVSIACVYPDSITIYTTAGFNGTILQDAGLARPSSQALDAVATQQRDGESPIQYRISEERFDYADGDVIFLIATRRDSGVNEMLNRLKADPLWSRLSAVQQGKIYEVPDYWIGSGPIAANLVIDDLFKYLIEPSQS
jgi:iron complex transport system substrate-binding protein